METGATNTTLRVLPIQLDAVWHVRCTQKG